MRVRVNGADRDLAEGTTLPALLADLGLGAGWVVVERNGVALLRSETERTTLEDGDVLEIVRAVAGG
ncbi:MAG TPA: sulfur carrier protein ThiS [Frankiaceae bacterium]|nr:sulfur carrier protein ThiS [Frankiaceae bacterium]